MRYRNTLILCLLLICFFTKLSAQQRHILLTLDSLWQKSENYNTQLEISRQQVYISKTETEALKRDLYTPQLEATAGLGYISDAHVWNNSFQNGMTVDMPHKTMDFAINAGYLLYGAGKVKNTVEQATIRNQIAKLSYSKDKEDIQFLLLAQYLDLFTLYNQQRVYKQNIKLTQQRLKNIEQRVEEGMLTHNDIVRSKLQLTNQQIQLNRVNNNILVVNHDLGVKLGLNANTIIDVDTLLYDQFFNRTTSQSYNDSSYTSALDIALSRKNIELAKRQVNIAHSQQFPTLSLYVSGVLDRPSLNSNPPVDIYTNISQVGLKLKYNIGSLYTAKKHIEKSEMDYNLAQTQQQWTEQSVEMASHQAYIRIHDAWDQYHSLEESFALAQDNYQVVEQKYLNKFSTITDVLDAATALLSSELDMNNAKVEIIYQWFSFMKITGNWENK